MAVGILAGLAYAALGAAEGANKVSSKEKELMERQDELNQKASDVRITAEHKRLSNTWDKNDAVIRAVKDKAHTRVGQYRLAKHSGDVTSLDEFDKLRGDTVWEVPKQGERPKLNFTDVSTLRAKRRTGFDILAQTTGFQDKETYAGPSIADKERELLPESTTTYRRTTDEQKATVQARRLLENKISSSSKEVQQRFSMYKNNLANFPRVAKAVKGLEGPALDDKLLSISFGVVENISESASGTIRKEDLYFDSKGQVDVNAVQPTTHKYPKVNELNTEINKLTGLINENAHPKKNSTYEKQIKALLTERNKYIVSQDKIGDKVETQILKINQPEPAAVKEENAKETYNFHKDMPGVDAEMLLHSTAKAKESGTPFTKTGDYVYGRLSDNIADVLIYEKEKARTTTDYKIGDLSWNILQQKSITDIKSRTIPVSSGVVGDSVFIIPTEFVPYGTDITKELKSYWKSKVDAFLQTAQANDLLYTTDDDMADFVLDFEQSVRESGIFNPTATDVPTTEVIKPTKVDVTVDAIGTVRETPNGPMIKTTKGWVAYSEGTDNPEQENTVSAFDDAYQAQQNSFDATFQARKK